jgi:prevent-host-death family protein
MDDVVVPAGEFKARCLQLIDEVARGGEPLLITKRGRAVARLVAVPPARPLFGALRGSVAAQGDLVSPVEADWSADR